MSPSSVPGDEDVRPAVPADAGELYTLQRACWLQELEANPGVVIPALTESLDDVRAGLEAHHTWVVRRAGRLVGSVRARLTSRAGWDIGRLMVAPDLQGQGIGRFLLEHAEAAAPPDASSYLLFTGARSAGNLRMYKKAGYRLRPDLEAPPGAVVLTKRRG
ncbi:GNAT family N-acetyltransferase [Nocardioides sp. Soil777]|uniref:GNAT family N-acetyltransferase n=1 Tax=Nocardioides sp. Soil777 TaxID=1736409 RepID=UPI001F3A2EEB|nr:GNAT family N-acetyltransferase [Nocardioides sp. Soil777]